MTPTVCFLCHLGVLPLSQSTEAVLRDHSPGSPRRNRPLSVQIRDWGARFRLPQATPKYCSKPLGCGSTPIRLGVLIDNKTVSVRSSSTDADRSVPVLWCSLECTPACQAGGRGFKSRQDRQSRRLLGTGGTRSGSSVGRALA